MRHPLIKPKCRADFAMQPPDFLNISIVLTLQCNVFFNSHYPNTTIFAPLKNKMRLK